MTIEKLWQDLNEVFTEAFMDDSIVVNETTAAVDIEGWDSMMHVMLIVSIEEKFAIRFSSFEVGSFQNVGDVVKAIIEKLPK